MHKNSPRANAFPAGKANCGLWASVIGPYILDGFDISTVPRGLICLALLRSQPDQVSARAVSAIFGFSNSSFTKSSGFVSLAGEASLVSISGAV